MKSSRSNARETSNVLFVIDASNVLSFWAPINAWEPHVLYQRGAIVMDTYAGHIQNSPHSVSPMFHTIIIQEDEFTKAVQPILIQKHDTVSVPSESIADLSRKSPDI